MPRRKAIVLAGILLLAGGVALAAAAALRSRAPRTEGGGAGPVPAGAPPSAVRARAGAAGLFEDVTDGSGIDFVHRLGDGRMDNVVEAAGAGGAVLDYDGDGWMDVYLVQSAWVEGLSRGPRPETPARNRLFRNRGDGTFEDATDRAGVACGRCGVAAAAGDYDGDGRVDLYVVNAGPNVLYRNRGDGTFEDVTERAGVGDARCGTGAVFFDADGDGRPDLYVANYVDLDPKYTLYFPPDGFPGPLSYEAQTHVLYRNRGDGTFEDVSAAAGLASLQGRGMGVAAADLDGDGRQDLYVANDATANWLLRNEGGLRFSERGLVSGTAYGMQGEATAAMAGIAGDYDGDGLPDLFVSDAGYGSLFRNLGGLRFVDRVFASGLAAARAQSPAWGAAWLDFDDDGDEDLFVVSGDLHHEVGREDFLFENAGDGRFRDASREGGPWFSEARNGRACLPADFDGDGAVDVLVTHLQDRAALLRGRPAPGRAWLTIALEGLPPNTAALGAVVKVVAGGRTRVREMRCPSGYLGQGDPRLRFGLGAAEAAERVEVRWPSGRSTVLEGVKARRVLAVREEAAR
jgi:enediyne biosynthesis protein E4